MTNETPKPEADDKRGENKPPEDAGSASQGSKPSGNHAEKPRSRKQVPIPDVDEILRQLIQLNGAVLMGSMSSKEAGFVQKNLKLVLDAQLKRANSGDNSPSPNQEALADVCRRDPRSLTALEPFLTDDQIQTLMGQITDDSNESL